MPPSKPVLPISDSQSFPFPSDQAAVPSVGVVFFTSGPTDVSWFVMAWTFDSFKGVFRGRFWPNSVKKIAEAVKSEFNSLVPANAPRVLPVSSLLGSRKRIELFREQFFEVYPLFPSIVKLGHCCSWVTIKRVNGFGLVSLADTACAVWKSPQDLDRYALTRERQKRNNYYSRVTLRRR